MINLTNAEVLASSQNSLGQKIITYRLTYPRIIHAEMLTHRVFSRNGASSRAIPLEKLIESVQNNPFVPSFFQKKHKGMQGKDILTGYDDSNARILWLEAAESAIHHARKLDSIGVTKQLTNRLLEPFQYYTTILTGTEFDNFFDLRTPKYEYDGKVFRSEEELLAEYPALAKNRKYDTLYNLITSAAEIHIQEIAEKAYTAYQNANFEVLNEGELHCPFKQEGLDKETLLKFSTAYAARVSFTVVGDGKQFTVEDNIALHDRLLAEKHASPFEHTAFARGDRFYANFRGFESYRHFLNL
jgi:hypothetical protein